MKGDISHARAIRATRGRILRRLRVGERSLRKTLERPPKALSGMTVFALIASAHNMGPAGTTAVLTKAGVPPMVPVGDLDPKQRKQIIRYLPKRAT